jgi:predicted transcriptional regulator
LDERGRLGTDRLVDIVRHTPVLETLFESPKDRRDLEAALDVSRATSHRFTRWLDENGLVERRDGVFSLTPKGEVYAEELLRLESNLEAADRLAPLLDAVCEEHREFVVQPFADATITEATPTDPYGPVSRFVSLFRESESFRGFNTTHVVPPGHPEFEARLLDGSDTEFITLPAVADSVLERYGDVAQSALEDGVLELRTREALPYGLALFDERVGIAGYDEETGAMKVFVDADTATAREWAESVYEVYRANSEPLAES